MFCHELGRNSRTWHWTYTDGTTPPSSLLESLDGPRIDVSDLTTFGYYPNGDLHTVTNAEGHVTTVESYDPHGRPTRVVDPIGMATEYDYDLRGRGKGVKKRGQVSYYMVVGILVFDSEWSSHELLSRG